MNLLRLLVWMLAIGFLLSGCVEKRKPAGPTTEEAAGKKSPDRSPAKPPSVVTPTEYLQNAVQAEKRAVTIIDTATIGEAVRQFQAMEGRTPRSLEELVSEKYLPAVPPAPPGQRIVYNPATGEVSFAPLPP